MRDMHHMSFWCKFCVIEIAVEDNFDKALQEPSNSLATKCIFKCR